MDNQLSQKKAAENLAKEIIIMLNDQNAKHLRAVLNVLPMQPFSYIEALQCALLSEGYRLNFELKIKGFEKLNDGPHAIIFENGSIAVAPTR